MALTDKLKVIADAIRSKTGSTESMTLDQMASEISEIQGGSVTGPYIEEIYDESGNLINAKLYGYDKIRDYAFSSCSSLALISLPSGITSIGRDAFSHCKKLALTSLPSGITSIGKNAFSGCFNLTSLTFEGTPTTIKNNSFSNCFNLTTINVPWAEGAVSGAPWGATKATINYNYTGE